MSERFQTRHPDKNKVGVNIDRARYQQVRQAILGLSAPGGSCRSKSWPMKWRRGCRVISKAPWAGTPPRSSWTWKRAA